VIENLLVYPKTMMANLEKTGGLVFSQRAMLALTQAGISREDAYRVIQSNAMKVWDSNGKTTLRKQLEKDSKVTKKLAKKDFDALFNYKHYTKNIAAIMARALK
jgi:adenylosuccinate lyase